MQTNSPFVALLWEWMDILMHRTMSDFAARIKESGLSMSSIMTLMRIRHKGARGISDIGEELGISSAAASQMLDRLVQQGLVRRSEDPQDRRVKQIVLTEKGARLVEEAIYVRQQRLEDIGASLTPTEQKQVMAALRLLIEKARQLEGQPQV